MADEKYIEKMFPIRCFGRDINGKPVLEKPVKFKLNIHQSPGNVEDISISAENCRYNTGSHGQRCRASHPPGVDKVGDGVICPYSLDIPYATDIWINQKAKS